MHSVTAQSDPHTLVPEFRIGAVRGAKTEVIQRLLARFAQRRLEEGLHVAGMIEETAGAEDGVVCGSLVLRDTTTGALTPITQNLGRGSTACSLDSAGLACACQAVLTAIEQGAGLVVLSKFGKIEAEGGGLIDAFRAAAEAGIPCITGVAPSFAAAFLEYAGGYSQWIEARDSELERWWSTTTHRRGAT
jgi:Protein of unknown function (DUF2478)